MVFDATDRASGVMGKVTSGFNNLRDAQKGFLKGAGGKGGMLGALGDSSTFDGAKQNLGKLAAAIGTGGLAYGLNAAQESATTFATELARVRTVTDEQSFSTKDLRRDTMALAESYGGTAQTQAAALYEVISAGVTDAAKATELLEVANEFAVGGTTDLKGAVDLLTGSVNAYGDKGLTAAHASDILATTINLGKTNATELAQSLGEVIPTAHAAGVSFEEMGAALASLTLQNIKTPQAVTGLNQVISNILKPSSDATKEAKRLGIEFNATALKTKGLAGLLGQLNNNAKVNDNTFSELFGSVDGMKTALVLASGGGAKFNEVLDAMGKAGGATGKAFEIMSKTPAFINSQFAAVKENALILIGEALLPLKAQVTELAQEWIKKWNAMPESTRNTIVKVVAAVVGFAAAALALGPVVSAIGSAIAALGVLFGPVGLGILAVIGIITALKLAIDENIGGIGDTFYGMVDFVTTAWDAMVQLFSTGELTGALADAFIEGDNSAVNFAVSIYNTGQKIVTFFKGLGAGFSGAIDAASATFFRFQDALEDLAAAFGGLMQSEDEAAAGFDNAASSGQTVGAVLGKVASYIVQGFTLGMQIVTGFLGVWNQISPAVSQVGAAIGSLFASFGTLWQQIAGTQGSASDFAGVMKAIGAFVGSSLANSFKAAAFGIRFIAEVISQVAVLIGGVVDVIAGVMSGDWTRVWVGAGKIIYSFAEVVIDQVAGMAQGITVVLDGLASAVGKDLGLTKKFQSFVADKKSDLKAALMPEQKVETRTSTEASVGASLDALAARESARAEAGSATSATANAGLAAMIAGAVAQKPTPAIITTATINLDSQKVGELVMKSASSEASRGAASMPVQQ